MTDKQTDRTELKVSFLVTYYNQAKYVDDSMQSILAIDKPFQWEILVGDDGSTDGTVEKIQEYVASDPEHIKLFTRTADDKIGLARRQCSSMNRLNILEHSTGDYYCILDGDDWYIDTDFVKEALIILERESSVSVVLFNYCHSITKEVKLPIDNQRLPNEGIIEGKEYLKGGLYLHCGTGVYRKCFGEDRIDFLKKYRNFNDVQIVYNALNYGNIYFVNRIVYAHCLVSNSVWTGASNNLLFMYGVVDIAPNIFVLSGELKNIMEEACFDRVLNAYNNIDRIALLNENEKTEISKFLKPYLPTPLYDLCHYNDLTVFQRIKLNKQLFKGKVWSGFRFLTKHKLIKFLIPRLNKLPYIRDLVTENKRLRAELEQLKSIVVK